LVAEENRQSRRRKLALPEELPKTRCLVTSHSAIPWQVPTSPPTMWPRTRSATPQCGLLFMKRLLGTCAEEDRRQRRRKMGLPEELTEEERAAEAAKAAEKERAKASAAAAFVPVKPVTQIAKLRELLVPYWLP